MTVTNDQLSVTVPVEKPAGMTSYLQREQYSTKVDAATRLRTRNESIADVITKGIPSAIVGFGDTVLQSVSFGAVGDKSVEEWITRNTPETFSSYYSEHKAGAQTAGDLVGMFIPMLGATKLARADSILAKAMESVIKEERVSQALFSTGKSMEDLARPAMDAAAVASLKRSVDLGQDATFVAARSKAQWTTFSDVLKEGLWADAAIYATMNKSATLFPEDVPATSLIGMYAGFDVGAAAIGAAAQRFVIRRTLGAMGGELAKLRNPENLPVEEIVDRPGTRHIGIGLRGYAMQDLDELRRLNAGDSTVLKNIESEWNQWDKELFGSKGQVRLLGDDNPLPGLTGKYAIPEAEINTIRSALREDPANMVGVVSVDELTADAHVLKPAVRRQMLNEVERNLRDTQEEFARQFEAAGRGEQSLDVPLALQGKFENLLEKQKALRQTNQFVMEIDNSLTPLSKRKPLSGELGANIISVRGAGAGEAKWTVNVPNEKGVATTIGLTGEGLLVLPKATVKYTPTQTVQKIEGFTVVKEGVASREAEGITKLLLEDIGEDWHYYRGHRGKAVFDQLPHEIRTEIDNWKGSSGGSKIREWFQNDAEEARILTRAYQDAGLHKRLEELADDDGTITLFRGERKAETASPTNDVVSMSSKFAVSQKGFARGDGKHVIAVKVPIDDVVAVIGGLNHEYEFIVKGAATRRKLGTGKQATEGEIATHDNFLALPFRDKTGVYQLGSNFVRNWDARSPMHVYPGMHHTQLDMAAELLERYGDKAVQFSGKMPFGKLQDLEFASLGSKFEEFVAMYRMQRDSKIKIPESQKLSIYDMAKALNLPHHPTGAMHPILQMFEELAQGGGQVKLTDFYANMDQFKSALAKFVGADKVASSMKTRGFMMRQDPEKKKPVLLTYGQQPKDKAYQEAVMQRVQAHRMMALNKLTTGLKENAPFTFAAIESLKTRPQALELARGVTSLFGGQTTGRGTFVSQAFTKRGNPTLEAADLVADAYYRENLQRVKQLLQPHEQLFHEIQAKRNEASMNMFMMARNALGQGWDVERELYKAGFGKYHFVLADTPKNAAKWADEFPDIEYEPGNFMPSTVHKGEGAREVPVMVDEMAMKALTSMHELSSGILGEINHLRKAQGKAPIPYRAWHLPAKNLARGDNVFLLHNGKVDQIVSGANFNEAQRLAQKEIDAAAEDGKILVAMTRDDVEKHFDTLNEVFGGMVNFSNPRLLTGGRKGTSFGQVVETGEEAFKDLINSITRQYEHLGREVMHTMFESELQYARHMKAISGVGKEEASKRTSPWDLYADTLYQKPGLNPNSPVGELYYGVQSFYDATISNAVNKLNQAYSNVKGPDHVTGAHQKAFKELENTMGNYNPFSDVLDFVQRTEKVNIPGNMVTHMSKLNAWATNLMLRILDGGMMVVNFASLPAILPAVAKGLHRGSGESLESWKARIGAFATPVTDDVAIWEPNRAVTTGIHFMFTDEGRQLWKEATKRGYLAQEVAERMDIITHPAEGYIQNIVTRGVNALSIPTDWSEVMSRGIAFSMFYKMGKDNLLLKHEDALLFAHKQANATIGDFRPSNRPDIFQGATGMPLGLFTTFIWNFWQRVASDITGKRWGAVAMQGALQHSLFGAESMPGFQQFTQAFTETYNGDHNMVDAFRARYGETATNVWLSGTIANLPRLMGLSDDGLAIQTRADVDFPLGRLPGVAAPPAFSLMETIYQGVGETLSSLKREGGFNGQALAEIGSNYGVNGFIRGGFNLMLGQKIDRQGGVVNAEINSGMEITAQLMSLKTQKEVEKAREIARSRHVMKQRQEILDDTAAMIRSHIRGGTLNDENFNKILREYSKADGTYDMFKSFLVNQYQRGMIDKTELEAIKAFKRSYLQGEAGRYLMLMGGGDHGEFGRAFIDNQEPQR